MDDQGIEPVEERRSGFVRRHKALSAFAAIVALLLAGLVGVAGYLNHQIDQIPRVTLTISGPRPPVAEGRSMNILLAGADNGDDRGPSIAESVAAGAWKPGEHRSDTIMVLHLTADRKHAYLISVPRDTYVNVDGYGMQKINAAFSLGGPSLYVQTLEQFTQLRMSHLAIIDWNGFRDLSTALGGVRVYVAQDSSDSARGVTWHRGYQRVEGDRALSYVRQRHGLPNGDFDRIRRQQNFLRSAMGQVAQEGRLSSPLRLTRLLTSITSNLSVDSGFTNADIRDLAWSLRHLRASDVTFIQLPFKSFAETDVGSVVNPDLARTHELFSDVATDDLDQYVAKYGTKDVLDLPQRVD